MAKDIWLDEIKQSLYKLVEVQKALVESSKNMQQLIVSGEAQAMGEQVRTQNELLSALNSAETKRMQAVADWARIKGIPGDGLVLSEIAANVDKENAAEIVRISEELSAVISQQRQLNEQNKSLLNLHLEYMDFLVDNFLEEPQLNNIYGSTGTLQTETTVSRIDGEA